MKQPFDVGYSVISRLTSLRLQEAKRVVTDEYEQTIIEYRRIYPNYGAIRIALALESRFSFAGRGTVAIILKKHGLIKKSAPRPNPN